jgi:hypothetical protein
LCSASSFQVTGVKSRRTRASEIILRGDTAIKASKGIGGSFFEEEADSRLYGQHHDRHINWAT